MGHWVRLSSVDQPAGPRGGHLRVAGPHLSRGGGRRAQHRGEESAGSVKASWDPRARGWRDLLEAAVLRALGDVVRPLLEGPFPPQLTGTKGLGVHLVLCRGKRLVRGARPGVQEHGRDPVSTAALWVLLPAPSPTSRLRPTVCGSPRFSECDLGSFLPHTPGWGRRERISIRSR